MKKLYLLLILSMVPMLAIAQDGSLTSSPDQDQVQVQVSNGCVTLTPDSRDFGMQPVDFPTASRPFMLQNGCAVNLIVTNVNATGPSFSQTNDCLGTLTPNHSCEIDVVFDPTSAGDKSQNLVVTYYKQNNPNPMQISAGLTGMGIHDLTFDPTSCVFVTFGDNVAYCTVMLQNQEPQRITIDRCGVSPAPPFSQDTACPMSLAKKGNAGDSVNIRLDFQAAQPGSYTGQFAVTTDSPEEQQSGNPYIVPLFGVAHPICQPICCNGSDPCPPSH